MYALSTGFILSIRSKKDTVSSTGDNSPVDIRSAAARIVSSSGIPPFSITCSPNDGDAGGVGISPGTSGKSSIQ